MTSTILPVLLGEVAAGSKAAVPPAPRPGDDTPPVTPKSKAARLRASVEAIATGDLPWLWINGEPRLVPGALEAYLGPDGTGKNAKAAAAETRVWLVSLAMLPGWGLKLDRHVLSALTGAGPAEAAAPPPRMLPSGASSGRAPRPEVEQHQAMALAFALAASCGRVTGRSSASRVLLVAPIGDWRSHLEAHADVANIIGDAPAAVLSRLQRAR
ncbi:hypothetical protein [Gemmatimonas sp.]|jgi:hypothetical protein|uniref:hypothetical protein n=1 Tax=Gemmatimonas sp. TaxID=1962908 RepID=UPI0037C06BB4